MSNFKISKGLSNNLNNVPLVDGSCYYTTDKSILYIDSYDNNNLLTRRPINMNIKSITMEDIDDICVEKIPYAMLYNDGSFVLRMGHVLEKEKTLINSWTNFENINFHNDLIPWSSYKNDIKFLIKKHNISNSMTNWFRSCHNLTGSPVCGSNVTDMSSAYMDCPNLNSPPVCGPNVTSMFYTYYNCRNLTGSPVCGNNVVNMFSTYSHCNNLNGQPVCGPNVNSLTMTYVYCNNLTGSPVCGNNVTSMSLAYLGCRNLNGQPVCGPKVTSMSGTYYMCYNLTGFPVCGPNVTDMTLAYIYCGRLTGSPVCGPKVTSMSSTYSSCAGLNGLPVCGNNVTNMSDTYNGCRNLTGAAVCGPNVTNMYSTYRNCRNLTDFIKGNTLKVTDLAYTFYGCTNITNINLYGEFYNVTRVANCFGGRNGVPLVITLDNYSNFKTLILTSTDKNSILGEPLTWLPSLNDNYSYKSNIGNIYLNIVT